MKAYVKPALQYVQLTAEEKFANPSTCVEQGMCSGGFRFAF